MKTRILRITELLSPLHPASLEITDESSAHKGHAGVDGTYEETHLKIKIKAEFGDLSIVEKHRKIKALIKEEFEKGLHAISIVLI